MLFRFTPGTKIRKHPESQYSPRIIKNIPALFLFLPDKDIQVEHTITRDCRSGRTHHGWSYPPTEGCGSHGFGFQTTLHQVNLLACGSQVLERFHEDLLVQKSVVSYYRCFWAVKLHKCVRDEHIQSIIEFGGFVQRYRMDRLFSRVMWAPRKAAPPTSAGVLIELNVNKYNNVGVITET